MKISAGRQASEALPGLEGLFPGLPACGRVSARGLGACHVGLSAWGCLRVPTAQRVASPRLNGCDVFCDLVTYCHFCHILFIRSKALCPRGGESLSTFQREVCTKCVYTF